MLVYGHLHKVGHSNAGNLHRILEAEEKAHTRSILDRHIQQVLAQELHRALGNGKLLISCQHRRKGTLTRTVGAHNSVYLTGTYLKVDTSKNLLIANLGVQILYT